MEAFLAILAPRLLGDTAFATHTFQCKDDLLLRLPKRLAGDAAWMPASWRIVVIVDRDDDECAELKAKLEAAARAAGMSTRFSAPRRWQLVNRIAIEELEAWYFGDWKAVRAAYPRVPSTTAERAGLRDPDAIRGGTWETFERTLQKAGYFTTGLRKIEAARRIAAEMDPARNRSASFVALREVLGELASSAR